MKIKEIEVTYGVTRNMGNYESLRLDYTYRIVLGEDEVPIIHLTKAREYLRDKIQEAVKEEIDFLHGSSKPVRRG